MTTLDKILKFVKQLSTNKPLLSGLPLLTFLLVGSYGLSEFTQVRYEMKKRHGRSLEMDEQLKARKLKRKPKQSMEEIYEETMNKLDTNAWFNIRGPRPDENSRAMQQEQREKH